MAFRRHSVNGWREEQQRRSPNHAYAYCFNSWPRLSAASPLSVVNSLGDFGHFPPFPLDGIPNFPHVPETTFPSLAAFTLSKWLQHLLQCGKQGHTSGMMLTFMDFVLSTGWCPIDCNTLPQCCEVGQPAGRESWDLGTHRQSPYPGGVIVGTLWDSMQSSPVFYVTDLKSNFYFFLP